LPGSIASGAALSQWVLPVPSPTPQRAYARQFTTDGNHLVAVYSPTSTTDPNKLVVWDLTTQTIVRSAEFDNDDWPYSVAPGSYSDPMWVASARPTSTDGGTATLVTLTDIAQSSPVKVQAVMSGTQGTMAFSPDGKTLAIGKKTGEVGLWDVSDKSKIVPPSAPLSSATSGYYTGVYAFGFTSDSNYLGMGLEGGSGPAVKVASLKQKQIVQKDALYSPTAVAFGPDNLSIAVGGMNKGWLLYCTP
jgi:WD40 repeat protein